MGNRIKQPFLPEHGGIERSLPRGIKTFPVGRWEQGTGLLADTEEGFGLNVDQLEIIQRKRLEHAGKVIAAFSDGEPMLVQQEMGQGSIYFLNLSPHNWSSLDQGTVLLPLLQRARTQGARRLEKTYFWRCGDIGRRVGSWMATRRGRIRPFHRMACRDLPLGGQAGGGECSRRGIHAPIGGGGRNPAPLREVSLRLFEETSGQDTSKLQGEVWRVFLFGMLIFLLVESALMVSGPGSTAHTSRTQRTLNPQTKGAA